MVAPNVSGGIADEMKVRSLTAEANEGYDEYLLGQHYSLFYHCSKYKNFLRELLGCEEQYLLALEGDAIRGALPLLFTEKEGRRVYNSLPYYGSNGGIISDSDVAHRKLTEAYNDIAVSGSTISSTIIMNPFCDHDTKGFVHNLEDYRIGQFTILADEGDTSRTDLMSCIEPSARRNVKKAISSGVSVERDGTEIDRLREMHQGNISAIGGIPKSDTFFNLISKYFQVGEDYDLYVARKDGITIAGLLVFYFNRTVEYFMPATDIEYRALQPLALILITALTEARGRGFLRWNWGGTWPTQTSLYRFKRKWTASDRHYIYFTQLNDNSLLQKSKVELMENFSNFFVVPFTALQAKEEHGQ